MALTMDSLGFGAPGVKPPKLAVKKKKVTAVSVAPAPKNMPVIPKKPPMASAAVLDAVKRDAAADRKSIAKAKAKGKKGKKKAAKKMPPMPPMGGM